MNYGYTSLCDALGSPRKMTNESGTVVWTGAYQPFGEMLAGSGNVHGFTGKELDAETGLNYFCQRYYDSQIGRFMTLDPIDDKNGSSPYAYCSNNPLKFTDPTGEKFSDIEMEEKYWFMKDYGMWKAGMTHCYTGWVPKNWFLGSSAELDPDFWAKGWDYHCSSDEVAYTLLWLSMMEWDVLTSSGWQHVNIGEWIKANDIQIRILNEELIPAGVGGYTTSFYDKSIVLSGKIRNDLTLFTSVLAHEATHKFLCYSDSRYRNVKQWSPGWTDSEIIAYSMQINLFGKAVAPEQVNHWRGVLIAFLWWRYWGYKFPE
ncbi:MAG: RHS repeat-associated core domain-containing protein [candidate division WOR-3 bacterium]